MGDFGEDDILSGSLFRGTTRVVIFPFDLCCPLLLPTSYCGVIILSVMAGRSTCSSLPKGFLFFIDMRFFFDGLYPFIGVA